MTWSWTFLRCAKLSLKLKLHGSLDVSVSAVACLHKRLLRQCHGLDSLQDLILRAAGALHHPDAVVLRAELK
jgi:hypothetical protein